MAEERDVSQTGLIRHGAPRLTAVAIDTYNEELKDAEGFIGDRASSRAFRAILEDWRERLRTVTGEDPLGETPSDEISKKKLDKLLVDGDPEAARRRQDENQHKERRHEEGGQPATPGAIAASFHRPSW